MLTFGGKPLEGNPTPDELMSLAMRQPSNFTQRFRADIAEGGPSDDDAWKLYRKGINAMSTLKAVQQPGVLPPVVEALEPLASDEKHPALKRVQEPIIRAMAHHMLGQAHMIVGNNEQAQKHYDRATLLYADCKRWKDACDVLGEQYYTAMRQAGILQVGETSTPERDAHLERAVKYRVAAIMADDLAQGRRVNNALPVEQGEVGFSSSTPMATHNVHTCVALMLRNPETHRTALVHVDAWTNRQSLQMVLDGVRGDDHDAQLEAVMVGAKRPRGHSVMGDAMGNKNVQDVLMFLRHHKVDVTHADIASSRYGDQSTALLVFPETGQIMEGTAGVDNPDRFVSTARVMAGGKKPLHPAFDADLAEPGQPVRRNPVWMPAEARMEALSRMEARDEVDHYMRASTVVQRSQIAYMVQHKLDFIAACDAAYEPVKKLVEAAAEATGANNSIAAAEHANMVLRQQLPFYLGAGAEEANKPMLERLQQLADEGRMFRVENDRAVLNTASMAEEARREHAHAPAYAKKYAYEVPDRD